LLGNGDKTAAERERKEKEEKGNVNVKKVGFRGHKFKNKENAAFD